MKQSDQKQLTRGQDSSDWYTSSLREVRGRSQAETWSQKATKHTGWLTLWLIQPGVTCPGNTTHGWLGPPTSINKTILHRHAPESSPIKTTPQLRLFHVLLGWVKLTANAKTATQQHYYHRYTGLQCAGADVGRPGTNLLWTLRLDFYSTFYSKFVFLLSLSLNDFIFTFGNIRVKGKS